jgi:hypothetical protein
MRCPPGHDVRRHRCGNCVSGSVCKLRILSNHDGCRCAANEDKASSVVDGVAHADSKRAKAGPLQAPIRAAEPLRACLWLGFQLLLKRRAKMAPLQFWTPPFNPAVCGSKS